MIELDDEAINEESDKTSISILATPPSNYKKNLILIFKIPY